MMPSDNDKWWFAKPVLKRSHDKKKILNKKNLITECFVSRGRTLYKRCLNILLGVQIRLLCILYV